MKSLAQLIGLFGAFMMLVVAIFGLATFSTLSRLGEASRVLAEVNITELRLLNEFQIALSSSALQAANYAQNGQRGALQDARLSLDEAATVLAQLAPVVLQSDRDGFADDRQARRELLVRDAQQFLGDLDRAINRNDQATARRIQQRLDLIVQDGATLNRIDARLLNEQTTLLNRERQSRFEQGLLSLLAIFAVLVLMVLVALWAARRHLIRPLQALAELVAAVERGQLDGRVSVDQGLEIGRLQTGVNAMIGSLQQQQQALAERAAHLEALTEAQTRLLETISALDTPILSLGEMTLVVPLIGHFDAVRAAAVQRRVLGEIHQRRARSVIFDLTGIVVSDALPLDFLEALANGASLLGARPVLAGISPELAQQMARNGQRIQRYPTYLALGDALRTSLSAVSQP